MWILIPILSLAVLSWLPAAQAWWRARTVGWAITSVGSCRRRDVRATGRDIRGGYLTWDEVNALSGLEPSMVERDAERLILLPWRAR